MIFILILSSLLLLSCSFHNDYSKLEETTLTELEDSDEHDAMCTCDDCMEEEDTLPEIEDNLNY